MSKAHGPLADRPNNPKVGLEISHESAAAARHRHRALHRGPGEPHQGRAARLAAAGRRTPTPRSPGSTSPRRTRCPGWSRC